MLCISYYMMLYLVHFLQGRFWYVKRYKYGLVCMLCVNFPLWHVLICCGFSLCVIYYVFPLWYCVVCCVFPLRPGVVSFFLPLLYGGGHVLFPLWYCVLCCVFNLWNFVLFLFFFPAIVWQGELGLWHNFCLPFLYYFNILFLLIENSRIPIIENSRM